MDKSKLIGSLPEFVYNQLPIIINKYEINNQLRLSHFLAQCSHESGNFKIVTENLNYSVEGLINTFRKYFPTIGMAKLYEKNPQKIANLVYANRMGNTNTNDGYFYRGRGYIQLTGKINYTNFSNSIGENCVNNPDLVATKYPLASAAWFFYSNKLHLIADLGPTNDVVTKITKKVNGGTNGLSERIKEFKKYYSLIK
jgi:putative chitinase